MDTDITKVPAVRVQQAIDTWARHLEEMMRAQGWKTGEPLFVHIADVCNPYIQKRFTCIGCKDESLLGPTSTIIQCPTSRSALQTMVRVMEGYSVTDTRTAGWRGERTLGISDSGTH